MKKQAKGYALPLFLALIPCFSGSFYTFLAFPISLFLISWLVITVKRNGVFCLWLSDALISICAVVLAYGATIIWAVDKGMACWGFVKHVPLLLYALVLMQMERNETAEVLSLIPLSGVIMTGVSFVLQFIPSLSEQIAPKGRLAGFFEYPNTYALFLLIGIVLLLMKDKVKTKDFAFIVVLIFGICLSGSRTTFALLVVTVMIVCVIRKRVRFCICTVGVMLGVMLISMVIQKLDLFQSIGRYLTIGTDSRNLRWRLLYFKDVLKVIAKNPFGLGYMGYANLQGSFQTGVYHVTYVHNELLQLLLDVGWVPVILLIIALAKAFFSKGTSSKNRFLMFVILAHCMMEFDLQFLSIWVLLISLLNFQEGKPKQLNKGQAPAIAVCGVVIAAMLWMCSSDFCYVFGFTEACLRITPFHTMALLRELPGETDTERLNATAEKILALDSHVALAYDAKANAAYANGDIAGMMYAKKQAIKNNRYSLEEYTDYFDKLYEAMQLYAQQGDQFSADVCCQEILNIEKMLESVEQEMDPLAWQLELKPELELSQEYITKLRQLRS